MARATACASSRPWSLGLYLESEFDLGNGRGEWDDDTYRVDLEWRFGQGRDGRIEPFATGYLSWDDRSASDGSTDFDYEAFVFGIGAFFYLGGGEGGKLGLALVPWARAGLGFQDGSLSGLAGAPQQEMEGEVGDYRFELALGVDAALFIGEKLLVTGGVGFQLWTSGRAEYVPWMGMMRWCSNRTSSWMATMSCCGSASAWCSDAPDRSFSTVPLSRAGAVAGCLALLPVLPALDDLVRHPRTVAMGGATVATATDREAQQVDPAALARHDPAVAAAAQPAPPQWRWKNQGPSDAASPPRVPTATTACNR